MDTSRWLFSSTTAATAASSSIHGLGTAPLMAPTLIAPTLATTTTASSSMLPHSTVPAQQLDDLQQEHDRVFGNTRRYLKEDERNNRQGTINNEDDKNNDDKEDEDDDTFQNEKLQSEAEPDDLVTAITTTAPEETPVVEEVEAVVQEETEPQENAMPEVNDNVQDEEEDEEEENSAAEQDQDESETRIDLVKLVPFDVKLSLTFLDSATQLNTFALTDIVTDWMDEALQAQVELMELGVSYSAFDSVILEEQSVQHLVEEVAVVDETTTTVTAALSTLPNHGNRNLRRLQGEEEPDTNTATASTTASTIATYEGITLWQHTTPSDLKVMTPSLLEDLQRQVLLQDDLLLTKLRESSALGLGEAVRDVRAYINPNAGFGSSQTNANANAKTSSDTTNANLELIIVVAIVVACMAFAFLVFSLIFAWRYDQNRRSAAYRNNSNSQQTSPSGKRHDGTAAESENDSSKMMMSHVVVDARGMDDDTTALEDPAGTSHYPESVISEDISTSLSAYYRSGMGTRPMFNMYRQNSNNDPMMNDNASMSSMEFDGYSLDGYAPSLGGGTYVANLPTRGQSQDDDDDDMVNATDAGTDVEGKGL